MYKIFEAIAFFVLVLLCASFYMSSCDGSYREVCLGRTVFCASLVVGSTVTEITEGYKKGATNKSHLLLVDQVSLQIKENNSQRK